MGVQGRRVEVSSVISRETVGCFTVEIQPDPDPPNPVKEWDNLGRVILFDGWEKLADEHSFSRDPEWWEEDPLPLPQRIARWEGEPILWLPLYFRCPSRGGLFAGDPGEWNEDRNYYRSRPDGLIYVTRSAVLEEYSRKILTRKVRESASQVLKGEVETFGEFLEGDCYGFVVKDPWGEHVDSCWGIYGLEYAKEAGRESAEYLRTTDEYRTMPDLPECTCSAFWAPELGRACCCRDEEEKEAVCS